MGNKGNGFGKNKIKLINSDLFCCAMETKLQLLLVALRLEPKAE